MSLPPPPPPPLPPSVFTPPPPPPPPPVTTLVTVPTPRLPPTLSAYVQPMLPPPPLTLGVYAQPTLPPPPATVTTNTAVVIRPASEAPATMSARPVLKPLPNDAPEVLDVDDESHPFAPRFIKFEEGVTTLLLILFGNRIRLPAHAWEVAEVKGIISCNGVDNDCPLCLARGKPPGVTTWLPAVVIGSNSPVFWSYQDATSSKPGATRSIDAQLKVLAAARKLDGVVLSVTKQVNGSFAITVKDVKPEYLPSPALVNQFREFLAQPTAVVLEGHLATFTNEELVGYPSVRNRLGAAGCL